MEAGLLMAAGGVAAGLFGSLLGLGGGILIIPLLTLGFDIPIREAVGVSLVCVIMTSSASAAVYVRRGTAEPRIGSVLELATAAGAVVGGLIAFLLDERILAGLFSALLIYVAASMVRPPRAAATDAASIPDGPIHGLKRGLGAAVLAGIASALLGIGGGVILVPVVNLIMRVPLRVAAATNTLVMGVTAAASAIVYFVRGGIAPFVAGPTAAGVFVGAAIGARVGHRIDVRILRILFVAVLLFLAAEMLGRAFGGR